MGALGWKAHWQKCHTKAISINPFFFVRKSGCVVDCYDGVGSDYFPKKWFTIYLGKHQTVTPQKLPKIINPPRQLVWGSNQTTASAQCCTDTHLYQVDKPSPTPHTNTQLQQYCFVVFVEDGSRENNAPSHPTLLRRQKKTNTPQIYNPLLNHLYP